VETTSKDLLQLVLTHGGLSTGSYILLGHLDHPGQLNDGLIGVLVAFEAVNILRSISTRFSYKALATMEILGTQLLLSHLPKFIEGTKEAIFLTCLSLDQKRYYQTSFFSESNIDRIFKHFARTSRNPIGIVEHRSILGNDENIFDSIGIDIPCGTYLRWPHDNYHTNGDNLKLLDENIVRESLIEIIDAILVLERNTFPVAQYVGVPRLSNSSYNLYLSPAKISGIKNSIATNLFETWMSDDNFDLETYGDKLNLLMRNTLRMSDGKSDLLSIADRTQVPFKLVYEYINKLELSGLVVLAEDPK
jgi:aminopeptidase-like protein